MSLAKAERNSAIVEAYMAGRSAPELADKFCLCIERIHQILERSGFRARPRRSA